MANVRGLDDILGRGGDDDDTKKFNDYYAGGEKSGQLLRGAPDDEESEDEDQVGSFFNKVRSAGGVAGTAEDLEQPSSAFRGTGRTLAGGVSEESNQGPSVHRVTFYRNNVFTVDDGPARQVNDPANYDFINSISKGECPRELDPGTSAVPVTVNLIRVEEDYEPPAGGRANPAAFVGQGRTLGSSRPAAPAAASSSQSAAAAGEWQGVDESQPTTSLQLRLSDGSRMVARFNTTHTLGDVRSFIRASRPDMTGAYTLATAFPPKVLDDDTTSLEAAGLLNAVLIQKQ